MFFLFTNSPDIPFLVSQNIDIIWRVIPKQKASFHHFLKLYDWEETT